MSEKGHEIIIPIWIMDPTIRAEAEQLLKYAEKYETIDMRDVRENKESLIFMEYRQF